MTKEKEEAVDGAEKPVKLPKKIFTGKVKDKVSGKMFTVSKAYYEARKDKLELV